MSSFIFAKLILPDPAVFYLSTKGEHMNQFKKSELIKAGIRKSFQTGDSKFARRKCYGYDIGADGTLRVNPDEANVVRWIFEQYQSGLSLGKIADGLAKQKVSSPTGRAKWSREAIDKLLSNEKYTGRVLLQKTISTGISQINNDGIISRYLYTETHKPIIPDELFFDVQKAKAERSRIPLMSK